MVQPTIRRGRESFPRTVETIEELPEAVVLALAQHDPALDIRRVIVIPPQQYPIAQRSWRRVLPFAWRWTPHRTLLFGVDQLVVVEGTTGDDLNTIVIPAADVIAIEVDLVLLYSSVELTWIAGDTVARLRIELNSVGLSMFEHFLEPLRCTLAGRGAHAFPAAPPSVSTHHFPLKFHNYTQLSLLPGEAVGCAVYEPALREAGSLLRLYLAPNRVIVLTDQHLLLVEDALPRAFGSQSSVYRINRVFIPRDCVQRVGVTPHPKQDASWLQVTLGDARAVHDVTLPVTQPSVTTLQTAFDAWFLRADARAHQGG